MYQSSNFATSSKFRAAMSLLWSSCSILHFFLELRITRIAISISLDSPIDVLNDPVTCKPGSKGSESLVTFTMGGIVRFCLLRHSSNGIDLWELFILPDGDTDSDGFRDEVSRSGIWNDFLDTVIAISMLS